MNFEKSCKNKKPHLLAIDGVLNALEHPYLLLIRKWGDVSNSTILYLTLILYKNNIVQVKKKIIKKQYVKLKSGIGLNN
jgi:hypothetical protein